MEESHAKCKLLLLPLLSNSMSFFLCVSLACIWPRIFDAVSQYLLSHHSISNTYGLVHKLQFNTFHTLYLLYAIKANTKFIYVKPSKNQKNESWKKKWNASISCLIEPNQNVAHTTCTHHTHTTLFEQT